jgi:hypothetical protein
MKQFSDLYKTSAQAVMSQKTAEEIYADMERVGTPLESLDTAREMKEFIASDDYVMSFDNTSQVKIVLDMAQILADLLSQRSWSVA